MMRRSHTNNHRPSYEPAPLTPVKPKMSVASDDNSPETLLRILIILGIPHEKPADPQVPETTVFSAPPSVTVEVVKDPEPALDVADEALKASPPPQEKSKKRNHRRSR